MNEINNKYNKVSFPPGLCTNLKFGGSQPEQEINTTNEKVNNDITDIDNFTNMQNTEDTIVNDATLINFKNGMLNYLLGPNLFKLYINDTNISFDDSLLNDQVSIFNYRLTNIAQDTELTIENLKYYISIIGNIVINIETINNLKIDNKLKKLIGLMDIISKDVSNKYNTDINYFKMFNFVSRLILLEILNGDISSEPIINAIKNGQTKESRFRALNIPRDIYEKNFTRKTFCEAINYYNGVNAEELNEFFNYINSDKEDIYYMCNKLNIRLSNDNGNINSMNNTIETWNDREPGSYKENILPDLLKNKDENETGNINNCSIELDNLNIDLTQNENINGICDKVNESNIANNLSKDMADKKFKDTIEKLKECKKQRLDVGEIDNYDMNAAQDDLDLEAYITEIDNCEKLVINGIEPIKNNDKPIENTKIISSNIVDVDGKVTMDRLTLSGWFFRINVNYSGTVLLPYSLNYETDTMFSDKYDSNVDIKNLSTLFWEYIPEYLLFNASIKTDENTNTFSSKVFDSNIQSSYGLHFKTNTINNQTEGIVLYYYDNGNTEYYYEKIIINYIIYNTNNIYTILFNFVEPIDFDLLHFIILYLIGQLQFNKNKYYKLDDKLKNTNLYIGFCDREGSTDILKEINLKNDFSDLSILFQPNNVLDVIEKFEKTIKMKNNELNDLENLNMSQIDKNNKTMELTNKINLIQRDYESLKNIKSTISNLIDYYFILNYDNSKESDSLTIIIEKIKELFEKNKYFDLQKMMTDEDKMFIRDKYELPKFRKDKLGCLGNMKVYESTQVQTFENSQFEGVEDNMNQVSEY